MADIAIRVENLSKMYHIGAIPKRYDTLRDNIAGFGLRIANLFRCSSQSNKTIWALKAVSFEVQRGEVVGIIGRNGAGKSTLLKILSRITEPTKGRATINGRVGSLLEVGTGFHPELTGRENIYLNGAILGMKKVEIDRKFDEIVEFSGVEKFIDTPVKRYSSGMYMRLAFSVAAHLEPEILLVDEVLAVGDVAFQQKCLGKMEEVAGAGRTVMFVSHNIRSIGLLCKSSLLLEQGQLVCFGDTIHVIDKYLQGVYRNQSEFFFPLDESKIMQIRSLRLMNHTGKPSTTLDRSYPFRVEIGYDVHKNIVSAHVLFELRTVDSIRVCYSLDTDAAPEVNAARRMGSFVATVEFPGGILNFGTYHFGVWLYNDIFGEYDGYFPVSFTLEDFSTFAATRQKNAGIVLAMPLKWTTRPQNTLL